MQYHALIKGKPEEDDINYRDADKTLNAIWIELTPDAKYINWDRYSRGIGILNKGITKYKDHPDKLEEALNMKAIFLKDLQEVSGKGSKRKEKDERM